MMMLTYFWSNTDRKHLLKYIFFKIFRNTFFLQNCTLVFLLVLDFLSWQIEYDRNITGSLQQKQQLSRCICSVTLDTVCQLNVTWTYFGGGSVLSAKSRYLSASCILLGYRRRKQTWPGLFALHHHPAVLDGRAVNPHWQHTHTQLDYIHICICTCICMKYCPGVCMRCRLKYISNFIMVAALRL